MTGTSNASVVMTRVSKAGSDVGHTPYRRPGPLGHRPPGSVKRAMTTTSLLLLALAFVASACRGSGGPSFEGHGTGHGGRRSTGASSGGLTDALAYTQCMRSHGIPDFPDPTAGSGGGFTFQITEGRGSDLDHDNPRFKAATQSCRSWWPGEREPSPPSVQKVAAEVKWAGCMRDHGLAGFPDPDSQGAFDSSRFDDSTPAYQTASKACARDEPAGPISAVPGHGPG